MKQNIIYVLLILTLNSFCQTGSIKGIVRNGVDKIPSQFITIRLFQYDKLISGTITDSTGHFVIENIRTGEYELKCAFVGYQYYFIPNIQILKDSAIKLEINYPCPYGNKKQKKICPYGHRNNIIPIAYGLPTERTFKRLENGKCKFGGCGITECDPKWHCKKHQIEF
jgi:hypothetical protein